MQTGVGGSPLSMNYMHDVSLGINSIENLLNSKECHNFLDVMQNNIFNLYCEIFMQVINLLSVLFYHTWFYARYSYWCQSVFDRGDKH